MEHTINAKDLVNIPHLGKMHLLWFDGEIAYYNLSIYATPNNVLYVKEYNGYRFSEDGTASPLKTFLCGFKDKINLKACIDCIDNGVQVPSKEIETFIKQHFRNYFKPNL